MKYYEPFGQLSRVVTSPYPINYRLLYMSGGFHPDF